MKIQLNFIADNFTTVLSTTEETLNMKIKINTLYCQNRTEYKITHDFHKFQKRGK